MGKNRWEIRAQKARFFFFFFFFQAADMFDTRFHCVI